MDNRSEDWVEMDPTSLVSTDIWEATELGLLNEVKYWFKKYSGDMAYFQDSFYNFTPLYHAAAFGYLEIVRFLWTEYTLKYLHKNNLWKPFKWTLFNKANDLYNLQKKLHTGTEEYYISMNNNKMYLMPLQVAAANGHLKIVQYLCTNGCSINSLGDINNTTALHTASLLGHLNVVVYLLKLGAEVNCKDIVERTPLFYATLKGHGQIIKKLIDFGADANSVDDRGSTPLLVAIQSRNQESVKYLIESGVDVNFGPVNPLLCALQSHIPIEISKMLIDAGADVNHKDKFSFTPFHYAAHMNRNIKKVQILLDHGALVYLYGFPLHYSNAKNAIRDYRNSLKKCKYISNTFRQFKEQAISKSKKNFPEIKVWLVLCCIIYYFINLPYVIWEKIIFV